MRVSPHGNEFVGGVKFNDTAAQRHREFLDAGRFAHRSGARWDHRSARAIVFDRGLPRKARDTVGWEPPARYGTSIDVALAVTHGNMSETQGLATQPPLPSRHYNRQGT